MAVKKICSLENKNVLVTGGAGFIGSHLIDYIIREENASKLVVADNFFLGKSSNLLEAKKVSPDLVIERCDVGDYEEINDLIIKNAIDVVFNLASIPLISSLVRYSISPIKDARQTMVNIFHQAFSLRNHSSSDEDFGAT